MDRGDWRTTVHRVTWSWTQLKWLSTYSHTNQLALGKKGRYLITSSNIIMGYTIYVTLHKGYWKFFNKYKITIRHSNSTSRHIRKWTKNVFKYLYTNAYRSSSHNSQNVERIQVPMNRWMDKQNVVYSYRGISFSYKKEWCTNTSHKVDES